MKAIAACCFVTALLLGGCSNVKSDAVTSSNKDQVLTDVAKSNLTDGEKKAFLAANMRSALGDYSLEGKTVSQVIDEQEKWKAEQDAQAESAHKAQMKAEAERSALINQMQHAVLVQPISKRFHEHDYESSEFNDFEYVSFQFHNIGKKTIKGFKGTVRFSNSFGDKVIALNIEEGGTGGEALHISPGAETSDELGWKYNQFEDEWSTFRNTALSSMKAEWIPKQIIFADDTSLVAPESD